MKKLTNFELFCLIFYALDAVWDDSHDKKLGEYLSDANPFLWAEKVSADPAVYDDFCKYIPQERIAIEESYDFARGYINVLPARYVKAVRNAFAVITKEKWLNSVEKYLSNPHK